MDDAARNPWLAVLGFEVPDVAALSRARSVNLRHLLIATLLEAGRPMELEALAERIARLGTRGSVETLRTSLLKCWRGTPPLYRDGEGRFGLDPRSDEWPSLKYRLYPDARPPVHREPPATPPPPSAERALDRSELEDGLRDAELRTLSAARLAAAAVEAMGRPLLPAEIEAFWAAITDRRRPITQAQAARWRGPLVETLASGEVVLRDNVAQLHRMRAELRAQCARREAERAQERRIAQSWESFRARRRQEAVSAHLKRRVLVHAFLSGQTAVALTLLDVGERRLETRVGEDVAGAVTRLREYDVVVGLDVGRMLRLLGAADFAGRKVDLAAVPKSRRLNRQGRVLKLTPSMWMRSSLNLSRPLGEPKKLARYAADGQWARLARRLESDAKALFAWYSYGVVQHAVAVPGALRLVQLRRAAQRRAAALGLPRRVPLRRLGGGGGRLLPRLPRGGPPGPWRRGGRGDRARMEGPLGPREAGRRGRAAGLEPCRPRAGRPPLVDLPPGRAGRAHPLTAPARASRRNENGSPTGAGRQASSLVGSSTGAVARATPSRMRSEAMIDRRQKTADRVEADRRSFVRRIARRVETDGVLVSGRTVWLRMLRELSSA